MQCPVCRLDQLIVEHEGVELDLCIDGHGIWFDKDELRQLFELEGLPAGLYDLEERMEQLPRSRQGPKRRCPRCSKRMDQVQAPGVRGPVVLDRCSRGHGIWFDRGELEQIIALEASEFDPRLRKVREFLVDYSNSPQDQEQEKEEC